MVNADRINELVEKGLESLGFDDCYLIETKISGKKIEIYLDSDSQVTFDKCQKLSRFLEAVLDEEKWLGEDYILEVSSAGVGRPLRLPRQYLKNIGRRIEVKTKTGQTIKGILASASDETVRVTWQEKEKQGKKRVLVDKEEKVHLDEIEKAKIKVSF